MGIAAHIGQQSLAIGGGGAGAEDESTHGLDSVKFGRDCTSVAVWSWILNPKRSVWFSTERSGYPEEANCNALISMEIPIQDAGLAGTEFKGMFL
tara:strand:+ start:951 stop:1235 length:285 start_codon:yes stop_codon:yes gene_type:complete